MRLTKLLSLTLVFVILLSVCVVSASAGTKINFKPVVSGGKIYGTSLETDQAVFRTLFKNKGVDLYRDGKLLSTGEEVNIGTGFTAKINNRFYPIVVMGDVDGDGELTPTDYLLVKRAYMGTYTIGTLAREAVGVAENAELRAINYIMVKRAYFGTYDINYEYACAPYDPEESSGWSDNWI